MILSKYKRNITIKLWVPILAAVVILLAWYAAERPDLKVRLPTGTISVHYIDVGQAECTLIRTAGGNVLMDAGGYDTAEKVSKYLRNHGVRKIDILIATHPHGDHVGGMATILNDFDIGMVIMPQATGIGLSYERMLLAMQDQKLRAHVPSAGQTFALGGAEFTVLAPNSDDYDNQNNLSVVLRMTYGIYSFLFTGDAEALSEQEIIRSGYELSSDFMGIGHHGSRTSTTEEFLSAVAPKLAFISVGKGNSHGHPHPAIIERLKDYGAEVYRTDRHGDIMVETDGVRYRVITEKG